MQKYITESVGILEVFQIIVAIVALTLGYHGFVTDIDWNTHVEKDGINICVDMNKEIFKQNSSALLKSECKYLSKNDTLEDCGPSLKEVFLTSPKGPFVKGTQNYRKFFDSNVERWQASEVTFIVFITLTTLFLFVHIIVASISKNLNWRTKWNAALQGIILFASGFSTMLLAISINSINNKYHTIITAPALPECRLLRYCDGIQPRSKLDKIFEVIIDKVQAERQACQEYTMKSAVCILLMVIICTCITMILMAMELTTKYEEEVEEEELKHGDGEFAQLLEEEINFENIQGSDSANHINEAALHHTRVGLGRKSSFHRSGSHAIQEYLFQSHVT